MPYGYRTDGIFGQPGAAIDVHRQARLRVTIRVGHRDDDRKCGRDRSRRAAGDGAVIARSTPELGAIPVRAEAIVPHGQGKGHLPGNIRRPAASGGGGAVEHIDGQPCLGHADITVIESTAIVIPAGAKHKEATTGRGCWTIFRPSLCRGGGSVKPGVSTPESTPRTNPGWMTAHRLS